MEILGWISWGIVFGCSLILSFGCLTKKPLPKVLLAECACFWVLTIAFLASDMPKLFILWIMPIVFLGVKYLVPRIMKD